MGNSPSVDQAMIALDGIALQKQQQITQKKRSQATKRSIPRRTKSNGVKKSNSSNTLDMCSSHSRTKNAGLDKSSSHSRTKNAGLDKSSTHSRKNGLDKSSSHSRKNGSADFINMAEDYDLDEILAMVKELKSDSRGQELLDEFVDYQQGKTTQKPRLLELVDDSSNNSDGEFAITEIQIAC